MTLKAISADERLLKRAPCSQAAKQASRFLPLFEHNLYCTKMPVLPTTNAQLTLATELNGSRASSLAQSEQ
jgi:hypothetical protein